LGADTGVGLGFTLARDMVTSVGCRIADASASWSSETSMWPRSVVLMPSAP
jgi:hypothetical protein